MGKVFKMILYVCKLRLKSGEKNDNKDNTIDKVLGLG